MKAIVTTTIHKPTSATLEYCKKTEEDNWHFIIVGDTKTPHEDYKDLEKRYKKVKYLSPEMQEKMYPKLSNIIGWRCIQRRNIGFVYAHNELKADIVATVDDDNIPYSDWGKNIIVGSEVSCDMYETKCGYFDPLSVTNQKSLWHRGYPIQLVKEKNNVVYLGQKTKKILVQANLWDGDPDIDAMARLIHSPLVKFEKLIRPFSTEQTTPFNSQNTLIAREAMPYYSVLPATGRMDDIWGAYILQKYYPGCIAFDNATVYQDRNLQDLVKNLEDEVIGYRNTLSLVSDLENFESYLPDTSKRFFEIYNKIMSE